MDAEEPASQHDDAEECTSATAPAVPFRHPWLWQPDLIVFVSSGCIMILELVAGRIVAPYVGVSLYTWTGIIGVVLAGISLGNYLGGWLADRRPWTRCWPPHSAKSCRSNGARAAPVSSQVFSFGRPVV